jgi:5-methyltetrahydrofolate--homocysteine methyltransferase
MSSFAEKFAKGVVVGDGALGTMLARGGLPAGACPELWGLEHPETVASVYSGYFAAGSDFVSTNTFGASRPRLNGFGLQDRAVELNRENAALARKAAPDGRFVAGSMGPTGELLEPIGPLAVAAAEEAFAEQAGALAAGGVDLILIETMSDTVEALAAVRGARRATTLPILLSFSFRRGARGFRTFMGLGIQKAVEACAGSGIAAIGSNCGAGFDEAVGIIRELAAVSPIPVFIQPNAGLPVEGTSPPEYRQAPEDVEPFAAEILRAGARLLGGCCGTDPGFIRMIRRKVDAAA